MIYGYANPMISERVWNKVLFLEKVCKSDIPGIRGAASLDYREEPWVKTTWFKTGGQIVWTGSYRAKKDGAVPNSKHELRCCFHIQLEHFIIVL